VDVVKRLVADARRVTLCRDAGSMYPGAQAIGAQALSRKNTKATITTFEMSCIGHLIVVLRALSARMSVIDMCHSDMLAGTRGACVFWTTLHPYTATSQPEDRYV
jgi:hypothetical protein